jgi:hypothetical protein
MGVGYDPQKMDGRSKTEWDDESSSSRGLEIAKEWWVYFAPTTSGARLFVPHYNVKLKFIHQHSFPKEKRGTENNSQ